MGYTDNKKALVTVCSGLITAAIRNGGARHQFYLEPAELTLVFKYTKLASIFAAAATAFGKSSVGFLILRILEKSVLWQKWFIHASLSLFMAITVVSIIVSLAQCKPTRALWQKVPGSQCWDPRISLDINLLGSCELAQAYVHDPIDRKYSLWHLHRFCTSPDPKHHLVGDEHESEA